jgi:methylated-DNA-protein-cysteine methyltransferase related protein
MTRDRSPRKAAAHHDLVRSVVRGSFAEAVCAVVRDLRRGEVVSYGEVARRAGKPGAARAVGNVLATTAGLPWWRVVRASGELAAGSVKEQARRLRREGVVVLAGAVKGQMNSTKRITRHSS